MWKVHFERIVNLCYQCTKSLGEQNIVSLPALNMRESDLCIFCLFRMKESGSFQDIGITANPHSASAHFKVSLDKTLAE